MKTLYLLRHAKSDWNNALQGDHERTLAPRGVKAAEGVGRMLAAAGEIPDRVLTSSAVRARTTVELAAESGGWDIPVIVVSEFYGSEPELVMARVRREGDDARSLLLAGHEPVWSETTSALIGGGMLRFPTAALARVDLAIESWSELRPGRGQLTWFVIPRFAQAAGMDRLSTRA